MEEGEGRRAHSTSSGDKSSAQLENRKGTKIAFDSGARKYLSPALFSTTLYLVLTQLPLILLIFWLVRVRFTNAYNGKSMPGAGSTWSPP